MLSNTGLSANERQTSSNKCQTVYVIQIQHFINSYNLRRLQLNLPTPTTGSSPAITYIYFSRRGIPSITSNQLHTFFGHCSSFHMSLNVRNFLHAISNERYIILCGLHVLIHIRFSFMQFSWGLKLVPFSVQLGLESTFYAPISWHIFGSLAYFFIFICMSFTPISPARIC